MRTTAKDLQLQAHALGTLVGERLVVSSSLGKGYHLCKKLETTDYYHLTDLHLTARELEAFMNGAEWIAKNWVIRE